MGFGAKVKAESYPKEEIFDLINKIRAVNPTNKQLTKQIKVYLAMTYFMANRSGELLPYLHYKTKYEKGEDGKTLFVQGIRSVYPMLKDTKPVSKTLGSKVKEIKYRYDSNNQVKMIIVKVPVFKSKGLPEEPAYIPRKGNPFFSEILDYINVLKEKDIKREIDDQDYSPVYLFGNISVDEDGLCDAWEIQRFFWSFKKQVQLAINKVKPGFKLHSLRSSRATDAAESSKGDIFYVQGVTRHRDLKNLEQYVKPVKMEQKVEDYA